VVDHGYHMMEFEELTDDYREHIRNTTGIDLNVEHFRDLNEQAADAVRGVL
jgi:hypothetical protein